MMHKVFAFFLTDNIQLQHNGGATGCLCSIKSNTIGAFKKACPTNLGLNSDSCTALTSSERNQECFEADHEFKLGHDSLNWRKDVNSNRVCLTNSLYYCTTSVTSSQICRSAQSQIIVS